MDNNLSWDTLEVSAWFKEDNFLRSEGLKFWKGEQFKKLWLEYPATEDLDISKVDWQKVYESFFDL